MQYFRLTKLMYEYTYLRSLWQVLLNINFTPAQAFGISVINLIKILTSVVFQGGFQTVYAGVFCSYSPQFYVDKYIDPDMQQSRKTHKSQSLACKSIPQNTIWASSWMNEILKNEKSPPCRHGVTTLPIFPYYINMHSVVNITRLSL